MLHDAAVAMRANNTDGIDPEHKIVVVDGKQPKGSALGAAILAMLYSIETDAHDLNMAQSNTPKRRHSRRGPARNTWACLRLANSNTDHRVGMLDISAAAFPLIVYYWSK